MFGSRDGSSFNKAFKDVRGGFSVGFADIKFLDVGRKVVYKFYIANIILFGIDCEYKIGSS